MMHRLDIKNDALNALAQFYRLQLDMLDDGSPLDWSIHNKAQAMHFLQDIFDADGHYSEADLLIIYARMLELL